MSMSVLINKGKYMDKNIGVIKEIDKLGRIVIPKEYRERLNLLDKVEILLTDSGVLIRNPEYALVKIDAATDK